MNDSYEKTFRKELIYKSILGAMKIYYKETLLKSDEVYMNSVDKARRNRSKYLLKQHILSRFPAMKENSREFKELVNYLRMIVCPLQFKGEKEYAKYIPKLKSYTETVRKFNKRKLAKLLKEPMYCLLFKDFYASGDFTSLVSSGIMLIKDEEVFQYFGQKIE